MNVHDGLRLGDVSPPNDVWTKTHTVLRMILDQLHVVGSVIGVPEPLGEAQSTNIISTSIGGESTQNYHGFLGHLSQAVVDHDLTDKVQSLKLLLREKLHLGYFTFRSQYT